MDDLPAALPALEVVPRSARHEVTKRGGRQLAMPELVSLVQAVPEQVWQTARGS
ncbi:MAG: hypothetical protein HOV87_28400 [Catenulispora sp.]|nr:hypothetical protein [Catenulispora sp.]